MTDPVLIVGAGPTGLTAALELSRMGVTVRLIDKREAPAATSRAIGSGFWPHMPVVTMRCGRTCRWTRMRHSVAQ